MHALRRRCFAWIATLATLALVWQAVLPLAAVWQARTVVTLCTSLGTRVVTLGDAPAPAAHATGDHCPLCRLAAAGDAALPARGWQVERSAPAGDEPGTAFDSAQPAARWWPIAARAPPLA